MAQVSEACCTRTPVGTSEPVPVVKIAGLDVYATGNTSAKRGVVLVYDIFGLFPQTLKGADRLAQRLDGLVLVPDLLEGHYAESEWFPPTTAEKKEKAFGFINSVASPQVCLEKLLAMMAASESNYPTVEKWAIVGLCWGGKLAALASGEGTRFAVSGQAHPSLITTDDARKITIPHILLPSKDESQEKIAGYKAALEANSLPVEVETYETMHHGWMGARADFNDEEGNKEFERGYEQLATFFSKYL